MLTWQKKAEFLLARLLMMVTWLRSPGPIQPDPLQYHPPAHLMARYQLINAFTCAAYLGVIIFAMIKPGTMAHTDALTTHGTNQFKGAHTTASWSAMDLKHKKDGFLDNSANIIQCCGRECHFGIPNNFSADIIPWAYISMDSTQTSIAYVIQYNRLWFTSLLQGSLPGCEHRGAFLKTQSSSILAMQGSFSGSDHRGAFLKTPNPSTLAMLIWDKMAASSKPGCVIQTSIFATSRFSNLSNMELIHHGGEVQDPAPEKSMISNLSMKNFHRGIKSTLSELEHQHSVWAISEFSVLAMPKFDSNVEEEWTMLEDRQAAVWTMTDQCFYSFIYAWENDKLPQTTQTAQ